jgi:hypothetical protein
MIARDGWEADVQGHGSRLALWAIGVLAAHAAAAATFPSASDPASVQDWLHRETGAAPDQVVAIGASAATRILSVEDTGPARRRVLVEAQALNARTAAMTGVLTWRMPLDVDCASGRVKLGLTTGYASRRGVGPGVPLRAADADWRDAPAGTQLDFLRKAACRPAVAAAAPAAPPRTMKISHSAPPRLTAPVAAQVISSPDRREAEAALRRLQGRFGRETAQLQLAVAPAQVRGALTYRGLVSGFASAQAATAFCEDLRSARQACFVRQASAAAAPLKPVATR